MIQIECGVIGSNLTRIEWYFSTSNNKDGNVLETNNSKYTFHKISSEENLTVVLTINDLNEKNDTGYYWCRAFLLDGTMLSSTTSFELKTMDRYGELACRIDVIVKNSFSVCAIPTNLVFTITPSSPTRKATQSPASVMTNEILKTVVFSASDPTSTISPSGTHQVRVFYIIIGLVGFLILLCALLAFIVCLLCKKVRKNRQKGN